MVEPFPDEMPHAERRGIGGEDHVGVGEEQDFAGRRGRAAIGRMRLSEPSGRHLIDVQHLEPLVLGAQAFGDLAGAVGGAVVDHHDLVVRVAEGEEGSQRCLQGALLVVGWHHDGEAGKRGISRLGRRHAVQPRDR